MQESINEGRELFLQTTLTNKGQATSVIITPAGLYDEPIALVNNTIESLSGVALSIVEAEAADLNVLSHNNVIAFGNMADNSFIRKLYYQYYTLVDLRYPGRGGYVLRTIHNPLGTGFNVILAGGSDAAGVETAALKLSRAIFGGESLHVDRLMDIRLGDNLVLPEFAAESTEKTVSSWRDSFRKLDSGKTIGYHPAGYFGWNSISIAGMLYHMTGDSNYLESFKRFVFPGLEPLPARMAKDDSFDNPYNPLVENYHYRSHLLDIVWDLIEESPEFSPEERHYITGKLLERQLHYDADDSFTLKRSRHGLWHMMNIYSGSRYFQKYYPDTRWEKRLANIRMGFNALLNDPTWGERDTLYWVSTSIEPILEFFIMDGPEKFIQSGTARQMMQGLDILYSGKEVDDGNKYTSISLLHKAAWLLNEPRYAWMASRFGYDFDVFRIGQSYWPDFDGLPEPKEMVGKVEVYPLAETDWRDHGKAIARDEAFQILSYRNGLEPFDDYLLVDGFAGMGRNPYHLGAVKELRLFGKEILSGYENDVDISVDGLVGNKVPRAAALKKTYADDGVTYLRLEVPNLPGCWWERHILIVNDQFALVADDITPLRDGTFDLALGWKLGSKYSLKQDDLVKMNAGPFLQTSWQPFMATDSFGLTQRASYGLDQGESETIFTRITPSDPLSVMTSPALKTLTISEAKPAYVKIGPVKSEDLQLEARFTYVDPSRVCLVEATRFSYKGQVFFTSNTPETGCWDLEGGKLYLLSQESAEGPHQTSAGGTLITAAEFLEDMAKLAVADQTEGFHDSPDEKRLSDDTVTATVSVDGTVAALSMSAAVSGGETYFTSRSGEITTVYKSMPDEGVELVVHVPCTVLSLWAAENEKQKDSFSILAGCADDTLYAYGADGSELWSVTSRVHESFIVGDRYEAPWFTDPGPPHNKKGVTALVVGDLWQTGIEYIAVGRPSTVEVYSLAGELHCRAPVHWGDVSAFAPVARVGKDGQPMLLVAKHPAGNPKITVIDGTCATISDNYFGSLPAGVENMHAWLQRGTTEMLVTDLDADGREELVYTLSGHWNEIRVYDVDSLQPLWTQSFGPGKPNSDYVRGLAVSDLDQDGKKEIVVGAETGWLYVFDHIGQLKYSAKKPSPITECAVSPSLRLVSIGLEDAPVIILDESFQETSLGEESRGARVVQWVNNSLYVGRENEFVKYHNLVKTLEQ